MAGVKGAQRQCSGVKSRVTPLAKYGIRPVKATLDTVPDRRVARTTLSGRPGSVAPSAPSILPRPIRIPTNLGDTAYLSGAKLCFLFLLPRVLQPLAAARGQTDFSRSGRVDLGGCPPRSPTDPGLHITRTRFLIS